MPEAIRPGALWPSAPVGLLGAVQYAIATWSRPILQISQNVSLGDSEAFNVVDANSFMTCPPKTGPGVMLVTWAGERGRNAKEEVYTRAGHQQAA